MGRDGLMLFSLIALGLSAWFGTADAPAKTLTAVLPAVSFHPHLRAVSNWRIEAASHLDAPLGLALGLLLGREPRQVTRCVKLNNYWCIKRAGWAGEIAADAEGHVAFASATEGADVAALLLRRYYVGYRRHSAMAIVSHWAPAGCDRAAPPSLRRSEGSALMRAASAHLTTHGLGHTLRARFLATRGHRVAARPGGHARPSVIPDRLIGSRTQTPTIALGLDTRLDIGARDLGLSSLAALPLATLAAGPEPGCVGEGTRIRNYAVRASAGVAPTVDADLQLFDANGRPTDRLARVMENMSGVEIGPLGAGKALIAAALDHLRRLPVAPAASTPAADR